MKLDYTLQLADNALILGHRISEWCGHGPVLEQDIALTNTALDHLGSARSLYQYAAEQFNAMPAQHRKNYFTSIALQNKVNTGVPVTEDDLAYLRDAWDFKNILLAEQHNKDWAHTVARSFFIDTFSFFLYSALQHSADQTLAAVAEKSLKEVTYHLRWSSEWVVRLGDGTEESHSRMQQAVDELWMYTGEMFDPSPADIEMAQNGIGADISKLRPLWDERVAAVLEEATIAIPAGKWMQQGGKEGRHTEHLGYMLAEMQYMQRTYPGMEW